MIKEFAETLKNLRTKKGLTQTQLADRLWLNKSIISAYENEQRMPSLDVLIKLSYEFNVSMEYLLGIEKNKTIDISDLTDEQISAINNLIELFRKK
ncbi:MAG: helix-turn-helix transcriptional regulator [Clostridia bacterium]|nr:helix-turn-helix transcriptional regulator [Clostridia bacterium]